MIPGRKDMTAWHREPGPEGAPARGRLRNGLASPGREKRPKQLREPGSDASEASPGRGGEG